MDLFHASMQYIIFGLLKLSMESIGELITKPTDIIAIPGVDVVTFECSTNSSLSIMWSFNNMRKKVDITFGGRIKPSMRSRYDAKVSQRDGVKEADLVINKLDFDHAGTYICTDMEGVSDDSHSAHLTVLEKLPSWSFQSVKDDAFILTSQLHYRGTIPPRFACIDMDNTGSIIITGTQNVFTNQDTVQWNSDLQIKHSYNRTFLCSVRFCESDKSCNPRAFEENVTVDLLSGLYGFVSGNDQQMESTENDAFPLLLVLISVAASIVACCTTIVWLLSRNYRKRNHKAVILLSNLEMEKNAELQKRFNEHSNSGGMTDQKSTRLQKEILT